MRFYLTFTGTKIPGRVNPSGNVPITDSAVTGDFLKKIGRKPTAEQVMQIIELREAARRSK